MVSLRTALLPLLLLTTSASARVNFERNPKLDLSNLHRRSYKDLTEEQIDKINNSVDYEAPACIKKCGDMDVDEKSVYVPRCAISDQTTEEDEDAVTNSYNCICTDRQYIEQSLSCIVKECGKNATDLEFALSSQYAMCELYADVVYPKPEVFLNELCLLDDVPKGNVPTDVPLLKEIFSDYTFASEWPKQTATTWIPTGTPSVDEDNVLDYFNQYEPPKWTCTPTPLSDGESETQDSDDKEEEQKDDTDKEEVVNNNTTSNGNVTTKGDDEGNSASGRQGMMGMGAVVVAVAGLAVFL